MHMILNFYKFLLFKVLQNNLDDDNLMDKGY